METRKSFTPQEEKPKLGRTLAIFGVALAATVVVGLLLSSGDSPSERSRNARADRPVRSTATTSPVINAAPAASGSATAAPADAGLAAAPVVMIPETAAVVAASPAEDLAPVSYAEAEEAFFAEDWSRAAELFARYTADRPGNVWGQFMLGLSQRRAGDLPASEAAFRAALALDPDHVKSLVNLGRTLLAADRAEDAREPLERAVAVDETSLDAWRVLGRVLHSTGARAEALGAYEFALTLDPDDAWSLNNSGLVFIEEERFEEAVPRLERACEADGTVACFYNNLGVARERTGDIRGAREAYAAALAIDGTGEKARVSLARVEALPAADVDAETEAAPGAEGVLVQADSGEGEEYGPEPEFGR